MKVMYKSKEVANTTLNYNNLINKPYIDTVEVVGNITTGDLNLYNRTEIDNLLASARSVKQVSVLPVPTIKNTMYYVGPDSEGKYQVMLFDSDNKLIDLGKSDLKPYFPGQGIKIDSNSFISVKRGEFLILDSEGDITIRKSTLLDSTADHDHIPTAEAVYNFVMEGADSEGAGTRGLVPQPELSDKDKFLRGDATWAEVDLSEMQGATASTEGKKGLAPKPVAGDQTKFLKGNATWGEVVVPDEDSSVTSDMKIWTGTNAQYKQLDSEGKISNNTLYNITDDGEDDSIVRQLLDVMYPVGTIYTSIKDTHPNIGTWTRLATGRCLWNTDVAGEIGNVNIAGSLPSITGEIALWPRSVSGNFGNIISNNSGAFGIGSVQSPAGVNQGLHGGLGNSPTSITLNASNSSSVYSAAAGTDVVRPTSIGVTMWERTA